MNKIKCIILFVAMIVLLTGCITNSYDACKNDCENLCLNKLSEAGNMTGHELSDAWDKYKTGNDYCEGYCYEQCK